MTTGDRLRDGSPLETIVEACVSGISSRRLTDEKKTFNGNACVGMGSSPLASCDLSGAENVLRIVPT